MIKFQWEDNTRKLIEKYLTLIDSEEDNMSRISGGTYSNSEFKYARKILLQMKEEIGERYVR